MNPEDLKPFLNCLNTIARAIAPLDDPNTILLELAAIQTSVLELDNTLHNKLERLIQAINRLTIATRRDPRKKPHRTRTQKGPRK